MITTCTLSLLARGNDEVIE